jgi:hypothetical protein
MIGKLLALAASTGIAGAALACGACVEDKVAATYDHTVVTAALAERHVVVFAAIEGPGTPRSLAIEAKKAAMRIGGVDVKSIRSAHEPAPALSFSIDPGKQSAQQALTAIESSVGHKPMKLTLLQIIR